MRGVPRSPPPLARGPRGMPPVVSRTDRGVARRRARGLAASFAARNRRAESGSRSMRRAVARAAHGETHLPARRGCLGAPETRGGARTPGSCGRTPPWPPNMFGSLRLGRRRRARHRLSAGATTRFTARLCLIDSTGPDVGAQGGAQVTAGGRGSERDTLRRHGRPRTPRRARARPTTPPRAPQGALPSALPSCQQASGRQALAQRRAAGERPHRLGQRKRAGGDQTSVTSALDQLGSSAVADREDRQPGRLSVQGIGCP